MNNEILVEILNETKQHLKNLKEIYNKQCNFVMQLLRSLNINCYECSLQKECWNSTFKFMYLRINNITEDIRCSNFQKD